jgi:hypothetical protein
MTGESVLAISELGEPVEEFGFAVVSNVLDVPEA